MKKFSITILAALLLYPPPAAALYRVLVDTEGRQVKMPEKIERVVVLTATCIEAIHILGAMDKVAGISRRMLESPVYRELIPGLKDIPIVSQSIHDVNIEKLLAVKPSLVITMGPEHPLGMRKELVERIQSLGIPVFLLNLESLEENYHSLGLMGKIFHNEARAAELVAQMKRIVAAVRKQVEKIPEKNRVRALYVSGDKPTYIAGGYWGEQDIRVLAGGINVAAEIKLFMTTVSLEQINRWNPDIVIITAAARYGPEDILQDPQWKNINAVKNRRVYRHPHHIGGLFTPRFPLLLAWFADKFYPDLGIGWVKITDEFFRKFYGSPYNGPKD